MALLLALGYQVYRIIPFTPLVPVVALPAAGCAEDASVRLLMAHVLESNRQSQRVLDSLARANPDLFLAVETDAWWDRQLAVLKKDYPFVVRQPQDDTYSMHLFFKLELIDPEVKFLLRDYVPSIKSRVRLRSGARVNFHGLHLMPPHLGQDTAQRDAELLIAGRDVRQQDTPAIVAGDLNDVAWSQTTTLSQEISGLLDPHRARPVPDLQRQLAVAALAAGSRLLRGILHDDRIEAHGRHRLGPFPHFHRTLLRAAAGRIGARP